MYLDNRSRRLSARLGAGVRTSLSRFGALIKKHRRTDSTQSLSAFGLSGASSSGAAELSGTLSANGGLMSALKNKGGGGLTTSFSDRPEAVKMRQMVASFAAAAEQMRRNLTDSGTKSGACREQFRAPTINCHCTFARRLAQHTQAGTLDISLRQGVGSLQSCAQFSVAVGCAAIAPPHAHRNPPKSLRQVGRH